jgi:hypothetical protein
MCEMSCDDTRPRCPVAISIDTCCRRTVNRAGLPEAERQREAAEKTHAEPSEDVLGRPAPALNADYGRRGVD